MKKYWEQLTSQERRWLAGIGIVLFVVFNIFFVQPHFHDYARAQARMAKAQATLTMFRAELARVPQYNNSINRLKSDAADVPAEDQAFQFVSTYQQKANEAGVLIVNGGRSVLHTNNEFFVEQEVGIGVQAMEKPLVDFLYSLGSGNSLMRVKTLSLRPDQSHQQLSANLTIVASYQKRTAPKTTTPPVKSAASVAAEKPAPKPVTPPPATKAATPPGPSKFGPAGTATNKTPAASGAKLAVPDSGSASNRVSALGARPPATNKPAASTQKRP